jgi:PDDEXK-like domain of unknown function (DUF3799)
MTGFDYERQNPTLFDDPLPDGRCMVGIGEAEYRALPALNHGGMKDLAVSPLRYWHRHINPERHPEDEETKALIFGRALHCLVLEGEPAFNSQFACELDQDVFPELLVTIGDMRAWLADHNCKPKGVLKADIITQVLAVESHPPIWDLLKEEHELKHSGKYRLSVDAWERLQGCASALLAQPALQEMLSEGQPEVVLVGREPATNVAIKGRLDWLSPYFIPDLKTFTQKHGKSIDQTIADAIYYEAYYRQAYVYLTLHKLAFPEKKAPRYVLAFVESNPPHEVRLREVKPATHGVANVYWQKAAIETRHFCETWEKYMVELGDKPWRIDAEIEPLLDEEIKQFSW